MTNINANTSLRKAALVGGAGLFIMTIFAVSAIYLIFEKQIIPGDAGATVNNIITGEVWFRIGIICLVVVAVLDVFVAWALYVILEPASKNLSLLAAWFRLVYSAILCTALFSYANVLRLLSGAHYMKPVETDQLHADVMLSINMFDDGWAVGLIFFGTHLVILGYLVFKSDYAPRILGIVLAIAGAAYVTDSFGRFLVPDYTLALATFAGWGELLLMLWLLHKGLRASNTSLNTDG